jgi:hypothetical protein
LFFIYISRALQFVRHLFPISLKKKKKTRTFKFNSHRYSFIRNKLLIFHNVYKSSKINFMPSFSKALLNFRLAQ